MKKHRCKAKVIYGGHLTFMGAIYTFMGVIYTFMGVIYTFMGVIYTFMGVIYTFMGVIYTFMGVIYTFIGVIYTFMGFIYTFMGSFIHFHKTEVIYWGHLYMSLHFEVIYGLHLYSPRLAFKVRLLADDIFKYLSQKAAYDNLCKLSPIETIAWKHLHVSSCFLG